VKHEKKELGNVVLNDVKFQSKPSLSCFTHDVTMIAALRCRNGPQRSPPLHIFLISCDVGTIIGANVFTLLLLVACLPACLPAYVQLRNLRIKNVADRGPLLVSEDQWKVAIKAVPYLLSGIIVLS
jgi:hypothetical protein